MLDVLIPVFNANAKLRNSLTSIYESCSSKNEVNVIVVNNCSDDWDVNIEIDFPSVKFIHNEKNIGRVGNWNECLKHVESKFYMFLMAGDEFLGLPEALASKLDEDRCYVFDMDITIDNHRRRLNKWRLNEECVFESRNFLSKYLLHGSMPWGPLQTWIFPVKNYEKFTLNTDTHTDVIHIISHVAKARYINFVKHSVVNWKYTNSRFHAKIDLFQSKKIDYVISTYFLERFKISHLSTVFAIRFYFWAVLLWLRNPVFSLLLLMKFITLGKKENCALRESIFGNSHCE